MENTNLDLNSIFEKYDNSMPMPANFSDVDLKRWIMIIKNIDSNPENVTNVPEKLFALSEMCEFANSVNDNVNFKSELKVDIENFLTEIIPNNDANEKEGNLHIHEFNIGTIHKILNLSGLETFSTIMAEKPNLSLKVDEESRKLYNEFDSVGDVDLELIDDKLLKEIAKPKSKDNEQIENVNPKITPIKKKIELLGQIVVKVENQFNNSLENYSEENKIRISKNLTFSAGKNSNEGIISVSAEKGGKGFYLNLPTKMLINKSALEIRKYLLRQINLAVVSEKEETENKNKTPEQVQQEKDKDIKLEKPGKEEITKNKATLILSSYLKGFLADNYAENFKKFGPVADLIAKRIVESMTERDMRKLLGAFFDSSVLKEVDKLAFNKIDEFIGVTKTSRITFLSQKSDYALRKGDDVQSLNYEQQKVALMDVINSNNTNIKEEFNSLGFGSSREEKENFCIKYVSYFMQSRKLKSIPVTFENKGALGTFRDRNGEKSININLSKIKSVSELVMTLSHELTHATDSIINDGLQNNIEESITGSGYKSGSDVYGYLLKLKKICYKLNPNERRGRIGELSALQFMVETCNNDDTKEELKKSIAKFIRYQENTIKQYNDLALADLEMEAQNLGQLNGRASEMIRERLNYLKKIQNDNDFSDELQSIEDAKSYLDKLNGESENSSNKTQSQIDEQQLRIREERIAREEIEKLTSQNNQKSNG